MKKIALLLGTSNKNGNTSLLSKYVASDVNATVFNLDDYSIAPFDYNYQNLDDDFIPLATELLSYDHIIFATPVYWYTMSAQMKLFFDRITDILHVKPELEKKFRQLNCSVISTGASPVVENCFESVFKNCFTYLGMNYKGLVYCYCEETFNLSTHKENIQQGIDRIR